MQALEDAVLGRNTTQKQELSFTGRSGHLGEVLMDHYHEPNRLNSAILLLEDNMVNSGSRLIPHEICLAGRVDGTYGNDH